VHHPRVMKATLNLRFLSKMVMRRSVLVMLRTGVDLHESLNFVSMFENEVLLHTSTQEVQPSWALASDFSVS
jgi:hypothetical protein